MDQPPERDLMAVKGALAALTTTDQAARRRHPSDQDDDDWLADLLPPFALDHAKICQSKGLRREAFKTQVFTLPRNSHARTRMTHSLEVADIAATCAMILGLNSDLCRASGLAHDMGHVPFGHDGEKFLTKVTGREFRHEIFGAVMAQHIERKGRGLNLTHQTLECMRWHSRGGGELTSGQATAEADLVMYADKIGYVFSDFNDIFKRQSWPEVIFSLENFPKVATQINWFGATQRQRVRRCVTALCLESAAAGQVSFRTSETAQRFDTLRVAMYDVYRTVHGSPRDLLMKQIYEAMAGAEPQVDPAITFALLNDLDASLIVERCLRGEPLSSDFMEQLSVCDSITPLKGRTIDFANPDLEW